MAIYLVSFFDILHQPTEKDLRRSKKKKSKKKSENGVKQFKYHRLIEYFIARPEQIKLLEDLFYDESDLLAAQRWKPRMLGK